MQCSLVKFFKDFQDKLLHHYLRFNEKMIQQVNNLLLVGFVLVLLGYSLGMGGCWPIEGILVRSSSRLYK